MKTREVSTKIEQKYAQLIKNIEAECKQPTLIQ